MVLTLLPLTTTSRRRAWACPCGCELAASAAALCIAQPVKAIPPAGLLGTRSPLKAISIPPLCSSVRGASLQRLDRGVAPGGALSSRSPRLRWRPLFRRALAMADHDHDHHEHHSELSETQLRVRALETILTEKGSID